MCLPQIVAICGNPGSGKTETQKALQHLYGYIPVDDGEALRRFGIESLGLSHDDVYTQKGKADATTILGKRWVHRDILGTLGNHLESMFGRHIMPFMATRGLDPDKRYSFGSVRRDQGAFYKSMGGIVIGIKNPDAPPSHFEFDQFDESLVDAWIINNALSRGFDKDLAREALRAQVQATLGVFILDRRAA